MHHKAPVPVGIIGASGYTGRELLHVLAGHPDVEVAVATSRSEVDRPTPVPGLRFQEAGPEALKGLEVVFLGLPHGEALPWAEEADRAGVRVVDLTADHRPGSGRSERATYGLTELSGGALETAELVANPGCYATGVILALEPLLQRGLLDPSRPVVINGASGTTGAGRSPRRELLFSEVAGEYRAYSLGNDHRHLREMRARLPGVDLLFVPHLLPVARGILETIAVPTIAELDSAEVCSVWSDAFRSSPVVQVMANGAPTLRDVVGTDRIALHVTANQGLRTPTLTVVVALDNLGKGAAGQAVQNMNAMLGLNAEAGLRC